MYLCICHWLIGCASVLGGLLCNRPHPREVDRGSERAGGISSHTKLWLVGGMDHNQILYWIVIN